jgi:hypothetical protein
MFFSTKRKKERGKSMVATTECVRIVIPDGASLPFGKVFRFTNLTPERRAWISNILKRSEPCADPGDDSLVQEMDVSMMDPVAINFNPPPPEPLNRAAMRDKYHWTDDNLNYAMALGICPRPSQAEFEREKLSGSIVGGKITAVHEYWPVFQLAKLDELIRRLFPSALGSRQ